MHRESRTHQLQEGDIEYAQAVRQLKRPAYGPWVLLVLVLGAGGYVGHLGWKERQGLLDRLGAAEEKGRALSELQANQAALEAEKASLAAERDALQKNLQAKDSALSELQETHDKISEKMKEEIAKGEIALVQSDGRLRVDLVDRILFDSGDAQISRRGEGVLARVGAVLVNLPDRQVQVFGHTDNQPITGKLKAQFPTNWELSVSRALNVVRFLEERAQVPAERLVASGQGEHRPIARNNTAAGRTRNRRIEILLTPGLAPRRVAKDKLAAESKPVAPTRGKAPAATASRR
jgi:chemotaxis protein MotB